MTRLFFIIISLLTLVGCKPNAPVPVLKGVVPKVGLAPFPSIQGKPTRQQLVSRLILEVRRQEMEMLPFDEPRTEEGQQDGRLRVEWEQAYFRGKSLYEFNGDKYTTMYEKKPFVPQVCADFIVDTIDRTAGTWYAPSLRRPRRIVGNFDLRRAVRDAEFDPRRLEELMMYFHQNPSWFQFLFEGSGPKTSQTSTLKSWMKSLGVSVGDIIIFRGRCPWDQEKEDHNHSLFVTGLDKDGNVQLVTGNPTYPVERTLRIEGNRTPKRRVTHIVRLTDEFMLHLTQGS